MLILSWLYLATYLQEDVQIIETYQVTVHQLHVRVVDDEGSAVKGLKPDDFTVKLNGAQQQVTSIEDVSLASNNESGKAAPAQGKRAFLFVFDLENNSARGMAAARGDTVRFIHDEMLPGDLAAVFAFNNSSIIMASNLTADRQALVKAVQTFGVEKVNEDAEKSGASVKSVYGGSRKSIIQDNELASLAVSGGGYDSPLAYVRDSLEKVQTESNRGQVLAYLDQFIEFANYLRVMEGTKNLVLFTKGLGDRLTGGMGNIASTNRQLLEALQRSGAVVYTVDPNPSTGGSRTLPLFYDLSASTGGRAFGNVKDTMETLQKIKGLSNDYYLVNIQTDLEVPMGELARVKVDVKKPGVRVHTGKGLLMKPDFSNLTPLEQHMALTNLAARDKVANAVPVHLDLNILPGIDGMVRLNLAMELKGDYLLYGSDPGKPITLDVLGAVIERDTQTLVDSRYQKITMAAGAMKGVLENSGIKYFADLMASPGRYKVKFVIRDLSTGRATTIIRDVDLLDEPQFVGPILLTGSPWVVIHTPDEDLPSEMAQYAFSFQEHRLVPGRAGFVHNDDTTRLLYLFRDQPHLKMSDVSVAILIKEEGGGYQMATPANMTSMVLPEGELYTGLMVSLDSKSFSLKDGVDYKLMTRIDFKDAQPLISEYAFKVGDGEEWD